MLHHAVLATGHVLFPNLVSIIVLDPSPELEPLYGHFGPKIVEVDIDVSLEHPRNTICHEFMDHLCRQNPDIQSLKIDLTPYEVLSKAICALTQLEYLETQSFPTAEGLQHLGTLVTLKNLILGPFPSHFNWSNQLTFVSVEHFTCQCHNIDDAILLLSMISHPRLTHLVLEFSCPDFNNQSGKERHKKWTNLAETLLHSLNTSLLISLNIKEWPWYHDGPPPLMFESILTPLLEFENLCELKIDAASGMYVTKQDISLLSCSMPLLEWDVKTPIKRLTTGSNNNDWQTHAGIGQPSIVA
ncbi:hypothetical protein C0995_009360 [Termitomyces sp. Mi166|nr:hypothetical protein C0995_009360 [Termitomyces sp. Mi166\